MRRILWSILALLAGAAVAFFVFGPGIVERSLNRLEQAAHAPPSIRAQALHDQLLIADMHADTLLWQRSVLKRSDRGHVDLPRLLDGNVALQVFSSVTQSPQGLNYHSNDSDTDSLIGLAIVQRQPLATWRSKLARSLWHARRLADAAAQHDQLMLVASREDLQALLTARERDPAVVGGMLSIEGLHNLEGQRENLQLLFDVGYRMAGLTHFFDNEVAGSMHGLQKGGLTPFGREIVMDMESIGMLVDIAHLSDAAVSEVLAMASRPVVVSHGGVRALCDSNRNLTDEQLRGVAATGGLIGIGYWSGAVCATTPSAVAAAIRYAADVAGVAHVGLGSDYDGAVLVSFDTSDLVLVTDALLAEGFSESEIRLIMGGNLIRLLLSTLPNADPAP
ncbi:MAG: membrane dipeptidase [Pseudomonadota bacterium]